MLIEELVLRRPEAAEFLTQAGFPITQAGLATFASRGGGPIYRRFGKRTFYKTSDLLNWAERRSSGLVSSTAEYKSNHLVGVGT